MHKLPPMEIVQKDVRTINQHIQMFLMMANDKRATIRKFRMVHSIPRRWGETQSNLKSISMRPISMQSLKSGFERG
jgi:hypothetical protein